ncbi:MAG TPA: hypothetical protein DIC53_09465 [Synergistaceae bacterium]|jgi:uncharacterized protein (DUF362 family)/Pyruvate/2-oxoacid:ferredoxin oxidoreductase delta subunit|nr:hypothetical protein [Synergistaceae bacterium]
MTTVFLRQLNFYDASSVLSALRALVDAMGGMGQFVSPGERVLLKPNLLSAEPPDRCVTTHPEIVRAVARLVLEAGGRPFIADSPGLDRFAHVAAKTGMSDVARELGIPCEELTDPEPLSMAEGSLFHRVEVARQALLADKIINLPKLKTHAQMVLTLGVKNLFGTVVRQRKAEWHYNVGLDRGRFADLHLDIARSLRPALTILDGVEGMEGRGPGNGTPRHFGLLAAATDPLALDAAVAGLLGLATDDVPLLRAAKRRGVLPEHALAGDSPDAFAEAMRDVHIPALDSLHLIPRGLRWMGGSLLASRPRQNRETCIRCGKCVAICPAKAMTLEGDGRIVIDYGRCIRCYCCQEVCPANAIDFSKGLILRALDLLRR